MFEILINENSVQIIPNENPNSYENVKIYGSLGVVNLGIVYVKNIIFDTGLFIYNIM